MTLAEEFNHPHTIEHVEVTESGHRDQTTGEWVNETTQTTEINGAYQTAEQLSQEHATSDKYEEGEARLYTETQLEINDIIRVYHDNGRFTKYRVDGIVGEFDWLNKYDPSLSRAEYKLMRVED
jgi:hypothetical protein